MTKNGYAALITVLILAVIMVMIGITVVLTSVSEGQMSLSGFYKQSTLNIINSCVEDTLMYFNRNTAWPTSITLPTGNCQLNINSHSGPNWTVTIGTTGPNNYQKSIQINLTEGAYLNVTKWEEI